jgi:ribonuclease T2
MPNEPERHQLEGHRRRVSAGRAAGYLGAVTAAIAATFLTLTLTSRSASAKELIAGQFDYYALALSWSPTYCIFTGIGRNDPQCKSGRPEHCRTTETRVPENLIKSLRDIMSSKRLVIHEWKKLGSCSSLEMDKHFDSTHSLFAKIHIAVRYLAPTADVARTLILPRVR